MPQASDELRKLVGWILQPKEHQEVPDDSLTVKFLQSRGYTLLRDFTWQLPKPDHWVTEMEELCLRYLVDEWDYGWVVKKTF